MFHDLDVDNNGTLSKQEMLRILAEEGITGDKAEKYLTQYDVDGDGNISFEEFKKLEVF